MSENQLAIPECSGEESAILERFIQGSREIIPTVQVSLAKRITLPGSNRILCLAARTTMPLNEDDAASVSNLALRLSDGTNVVLSLGFFNDTVGGDYAPSNGYVYDPSRYTARSESHWGMVLAAMAIVTLAGTYAMSKGPLGTGLEHLLQTNAPGTQRLPVEAKSPHIGMTHGKSDAAGLGRSPTKILSRKAEGSAKIRMHPWRSRDLKRAHSELLVPPPPATYSLAPPPPFLPAEQYQTGEPGATFTKPIVISKSPVIPSLPKPESIPSLPNARAASSDQLHEVRDSSRLETKSATMPTYSPANDRLLAPLERISTFSDTNHGSAPLPGNSLTPP